MQKSVRYDIKKCSLSTGKVPEKWRGAEVGPFIQKREKEKRTINITDCIVRKISEKVIKKQYRKFLEKKIITKKNIGFRQGCSCVTNSLSFYSRMTDIHRRGWMGSCMYLDLKKAFDKVPKTRQILLTN